MEDIDNDINPVTGLAVNGKGGTEMMYQRITERLPKELLDKFQIVASRIINIEPTKDLIFWAHDTWDDPQTEKLKTNIRKIIKSFIFVSNYQFNSFYQAHGIPYSDSVVIQNGIVPIPLVEKPNDKINLIYHTTPHRGLDILLSVYDPLVKKHPELHLNVFSSFAAYGWEHKDEPFEVLFDFCRKHPNITYHGFQPNEVVRECLQESHIFAYPSTWPETSCISAIEAMSAGVLPVTSDFGALPETIGDNGILYRYHEDKRTHSERFFNAMDFVITNYKKNNYSNSITNISSYANMKYDIDFVASIWKNYLENLK